MEHYDFLTQEQNDALHYAHGYLDAMQRNENHYLDFLDVDVYRNRLYLALECLEDKDVCPEDRFKSAETIESLVAELHDQTKHLY